VKYVGLNDKFMGVDEVVLYDNGEFYLELGAAGEVEGSYEIKNDTVLLYYPDNINKSWPSRLLMTPENFISLPSDSLKIPIKIKR
jgi:hypothetical protein